MEKKKKKRKTRSSKRNKNKKIIIISIILIIIFIFLIKGCFNNKKNPLIGTWITEKGTVYQFNKNHTGKLILTIGEYDYKYEIKDDEIIIDFVSDTSIDTKFTYKFNKKQLILENSNGTFVFSKKK